MTAHPIPAAALDQPSAIVGTVGAGKTYVAKSAVEPLLREGRRVIIIDPTGVWHGLRTMADGSPGFPVVIFGGEHADVPVSPDAGAALGALLAEDRVTQAIVDVSEMTGGEQTTFLTAMLERLYAGARVPRHLIMDEADEMAPQQPLPEQRRLLGIVDKIVRRGRVRGFRPMMITQRPAVIHKNVLSQIATLVAMRLTSPQDRKAVEDWVKGAADLGEAKKVLTSLPRLGVGEGWVWAPREGILKRSRFPAIATLDTSATPDANAVPVPKQRAMAKVDVAALRSALAVSAPVPAARRQGAPPRAASAEEIAAAEQRGYERGLVDGEARGLERGSAAGWRAATICFHRSFSTTLETASKPSAHADGEAEIARALGLAAWPKSVAAAPPAPIARPAPRAPTPARMNGHASATDHKLGAERRILAVLAGAHPAGMTEAQWAVAAGMKRSGGTWKTYRSRLCTAGAIEQRGDQWFATTDGLGMVGVSFEPMPPPGAKLVDFWIGRIPGIGPMLRELALHYPNLINRDGLADAIGMAASGGTFKTYLSRLSSAGLIEKSAAGVRAAPALMERN